MGGHKSLLFSDVAVEMNAFLLTLISVVRYSRVS